MTWEKVVSKADYELCITYPFISKTDKVLSNLQTFAVSKYIFSSLGTLKIFIICFGSPTGK